MTRVNLLPWREKKREYDKKLFLTMFLGSVVFAFVIVILINYYVSHLVGCQIERNRLLQNEISIVDTQIEEINNIKQTKKNLISRMVIVQKLQSIRILMIHLFDELIKVMDPGIYVTKLERKNETVTLQGYSESNNSVLILMKNIEANDWIQHPVLTEIKKMEGKKQSANHEFTLNFILKPKIQTGKSHE